MSNHYSPQGFFRKAPNKLLGQYFATKGLLKEIEFEELAETNITTIYERWLAIPDDTRNLLEQDFQAFNEVCAADDINASHLIAWYGIFENLSELRTYLDCAAVVTDEKLELYKNLFNKFLK